MAITAIPTTYKGIEFRSRLEAKWAIMFDQFGWSWEYEPIDLIGYIPDFVLAGRFGPILVEVKPEIEFDALRNHIDKIERSGWEHEAIVIGAATFEVEHLPVIGLLGERTSAEDNDGHTWWWEAAPLVICRQCRKPSIYHFYGNWTQRNCKCIDYDDHYKHAYEVLDNAWSKATNAVKYRHGKR